MRLPQKTERHTDFHGAEKCWTFINLERERWNRLFGLCLSYLCCGFIWNYSFHLILRMKWDFSFLWVLSSNSGTSQLLYNVILGFGREWLRFGCSALFIVAFIAKYADNFPGCMFKDLCTFSSHTKLQVDQLSHASHLHLPVSKHPERRTQRGWGSSWVMIHMSQSLTAGSAKTPHCVVTRMCGHQTLADQRMTAPGKPETDSHLQDPPLVTCICHLNHHPRWFVIDRNHHELWKWVLTLDHCLSLFF